MKMLIIVIAFNLSMAQAYVNRMALKGGVSAGAGILKSRADSSQTLPVIGIASYFSKKWSRWEFGINSQASIGKWDEQSFIINGSRVSGKGHFRSLSFGPFARVYLDIFQRKHWRSYINLAPLAGIRSFKFSDTAKAGGSFTEGNKIKLECFGGLISIGWEEQLEKKKRPSFLEFTYRVLNSHKRTEVGGTTTKVESIVREQDHGGALEQTFSLTWGMLIF